MLPLNMIPIVGTATFLVLQGRKTGPGYHARFFQLKELDGAQRDAFIKEHHGGYIAYVILRLCPSISRSNGLDIRFGTMTMVMNLVPLVSTFFTFTSVVGAALWAAEIETKANYPGERVDVSGEEAQKDSVKKEL